MLPKATLFQPRTALFSLATARNPPGRWKGPKRQSEVGGVWGLACTGQELTWGRVGLFLPKVVGFLGGLVGKLL